MWLIAVLYLICASTFTISKAALAHVQPLFFTGSRMVIAGIILLAYYRIRGNRIAIPRNHFMLFAQIVLFYIYFAYVFDIIALNYLTSSRACLLYDLSPFISALFSYLWFNEVMTFKKWLGLGIGVAAFIPTFFTADPTTNQVGWPELIMLGAIVSSVYGWILVRQLVKENNYPSVVVNGIGMLGGGILAFITSFVLEGWWKAAPVSNVGAFLYYTLLIVLVANIAFSNLYTVLLKKYTATFLSFAGFTAPLFAALLGWIFLGETVSWDFFVTAAFVLVGLYIFYQEELKQGYIAE